MSLRPTSAHVSRRLIANINSLPLWVKQVVYLDLHNELASFFAADNLNNMSSEDTIAFFLPKLTSDGERNLLEVKGDVGKLLMNAKDKLTLLDICILNNWTLETCCHAIVEAMHYQWLYPPPSLKAMGTIEYLGNSIRLGEYLVKMGRISMEQLEQALRTQQYIKEAMQEHTGLANILINLGHITRKDTEGILFLKEESRKPLDNTEIIHKLAAQ